MELISTALVIVIGIVWFFDSWGKNKEEADYLRVLDEADEAAWQRERAYLNGLRDRADSGDKQAVELLRFHGCDVRDYN